MFSSLAPTPSPAHSAAELAALALSDERALRLPRFSANDAVTLGLSLRKRFRGTARHARAGAGALVGVYDALGHTLFACTVGDLAGHGDVGLEAWDRVKGMVELVRRTGHCTFYIEKGMQAVGKTVEQLGLTGDLHVAGGAFPLWLDNAPTCPIAIVVLHSGESSEDHRIVVTAIRDTIRKMTEPSPSPEPAMVEESGPIHRVPAPSVLAELHAPSRSYRGRSENGSTTGHSANGHGTERTAYPADTISALSASRSVMSASPRGSRHSREEEYAGRAEYADYGAGTRSYAGSAEYYGSPEREAHAMGPAYRAGLDQ